MLKLRFGRRVEWVLMFLSIWFMMVGVTVKRVGESLRFRTWAMLGGILTLACGSWGGALLVWVYLRAGTGVMPNPLFWYLASAGFILAWALIAPVGMIIYAIGRIAPTIGDMVYPAMMKRDLNRMIKKLKVSFEAGKMHTDDKCGCAICKGLNKRKEAKVHG